MIRTSTRIAIAAVVVSLFLHLMSIGYSVQAPEGQGTGDTETQVVELDTEFEALADTLVEPAEPAEPAETPPEPQEAETPTSRALVASPNPQRTSSPGTGEARPAEPETQVPVDSAQVAETPPSGASAARVETYAAPPAEAGEAESAEPEQSASPAPSEAQPVEAAEPQQQIAALPVDQAPTAPIAPSPAPTAIPILPSEVEALDPATPEDTTEALPEEQEPVDGEQSFGGTELAVTTSPRPPPRGEQSFSDETGIRPPPILMTESPLVAYARGQSTGAWSGREGTGGAGNASVTNYAGRVLVHLNNARRPDVRNKRGSARVVFVINADGSLASVDVVESTGNFELDRAARIQVRNASPYPRPPDGKSRRLSFIYRNR